ncbi:MAG TPA: hypothetical protein VK982_14115 [Bacteroidales bacterium]|nr:hypothetical protein [Bacteroidales bacterium]
MEKTKVRKKGYGLLMGLTIFFTLCTISTLIPVEQASKVCMLGYKAHCSFTPISTLLCAIPAAIVCSVRRRFFVTYK